MPLYSEGDNTSQESTAKDLVEILTLTYPDHPWAVRVGEGFAFVRYLDPLWEDLFRGPIGYKIPLNKTYSASQLKKDLLTAGGQLLEMMNLKRGRSNGDEPLNIEGVPKKFEKTIREVPIAGLP